MSMWKQDVVTSLKWNIYLVLTNTVILFIVTLTSGESAIAHFSTLLLMEAAIAFLLGSVMEMTASLFFGKIREHVFHSEEQWSLERYDKERRRAMPYIILGFFLLPETFLFSIILS